MARVRGLNHITLAVSELERSVRFYGEVLGIALVHRWPGGAHFDCGGTWLCLSPDAAAADRPHPDYTHIAFSVSADDFAALAERLRLAGARIWKQNRSEGDSLYFLDPDGHRLEIHVGDLASRLAHMDAGPDSA